MNGKFRKYLPLLGIVAVLVLWGLWYGRPVGVETLFPGFDPDSVEVIASDYNVSPTESYSRGTPEYDDVLSEIRGLRFRRSVWNPIRQLLPDQGVRKHSDDPDYRSLVFDFIQDDGKENHAIYRLEFFVDEWFYCAVSGDAKTLSLGMTDSEAVGTEMAQRYLGQFMGHLLSSD